MKDNNSPRIRDVPLENRQELFMDKLNRCSKIFNFKPFIGHFKAKQSLSDIRQSGVASAEILDMIKAVFERDDMLEEMSNYVFTLESLPDDAVCKIMKMLCANLFRPFPSHTAVFYKIENENLYEAGEKRPLVEGAWVHLRNFYEFLRKIVDAGLLRDEHIEDRFITWFFNNAVLADDYREACFVAELLLSFWAKFPKKQQSIWRTVRSNLSRFVSCGRKSCIPSAVGNLLQFVSYRIPEWPVPLQEEHTHFLRLVLIPMHRIKAYPNYSPWLQLCLVRFLEKESSLINLIFEGILSADPTCESSLLDEIKSLMKFSNINDINQSNAQLLFGCIAKNLRSSDMKVVRKGLDIASFDRFLELAKIHSELSLPLIRRELQSAIENNSVRVVVKRTLEKFYNVEDASWKFDDNKTKRTRIR